MATRVDDERRVIDDDMLRDMLRDEEPTWLDDNYYRLATLALIAVNVVVYVVEFVLSGFDFDISSSVLVKMGAMYAPLIQSVGDLYRFVAPMFLHMDALHLLMNMVALYSVGEALEYVLGKGSFLLLYFVAGITGNAACYVADMLSVGSWTLSAGASTSVFGLFVAVALLAVLSKNDSKELVAYSKGMLSIIGVNLVYTLLVPSISIAGHLGGAVGGLIAMFMVPSGNLRVPNVVRVVVAVAWAAACAGVVVYSGVLS